MSDIAKFDEQYVQWIKDISSRFRQSQIKAACRVNIELMQQSSPKHPNDVPQAGFTAKTDLLNK